MIPELRPPSALAHLAVPALALVTVLAGCAPDADRPSEPPGPAAGNFEGGEVVARVGDRSITASDLEATRLGRAGRMRRPERRSASPGEWRALLERRIDQLLVEEEAAERGISSDPAYLAERDAILGQAELRVRELQRTLLLAKLADEAEVRDEELRERMDQMPRRFRARVIHVRRLVVDDEAAARAAARRIAAGEDFGEVAAEVSTDPALRRSRGDLGPRERFALPPEVAARTRALQEGEVSEPFRAEAGWNLIQLVAGPQDATRAFEDVRPQLEQEVRAAKAAETLARLLVGRRTALGVTIDEERLATLAAAAESPPSNTGAAEAGALIAE